MTSSPEAAKDAAPAPTVSAPASEATTTPTPIPDASAPASAPSDSKKAENSAPAEAELPVTELSRLEIRVGVIESIAPHPDADTLYVEQINVGEESGARTIVSGLVKYIPEMDSLKDRRVLVLCNLKPRAMRGIKSCGMLLCASNGDHSVVDPLTPPEGAAVGELITFDGHKSAPVDPSNRAGKAWDRVAPKLRCKGDGIARFEDTPFMTSAGPVFTAKKLEGPIS